MIRCRNCSKAYLEHLRRKDGAPLCPNRSGHRYRDWMIVTSRDKAGLGHRIAQALAEVRANNRARLVRAS